MQKLPDNYEKNFWDLLIPVVTEGTAKNRRNLIVISFIIISIYVLDKSLTDLRVFGLSIEGSNKGYVLVLAILLIAFWTFMFIGNYLKDLDINLERKHILNKNIESLKTSKERFEKKYSDVADDHPNKRTMKEIQREYSIYTAQLERTKRGRILTAILSGIEAVLPLLLSAVAICLLFLDLINVHTTTP